MVSQTKDTRASGLRARRVRIIGPEIKPVDQCAQSPETNTLDLGFNKSLDSRLPQVRDFNLDKFEDQILQAWDEYPSEKLDDLYDMKSRVIECILTSNPPGGNNFTMPHRAAADK